MGVEYEHYLIPEDNAYKPGPDDLSRLVDALLDGGFVARAGWDGPERKAFEKSAPTELVGQGEAYVDLGSDGWIPFACPCPAADLAALGDRDYMLVWPVESSNESGLVYPLTPFPEWGDAYYDLELRLARDFVYHCSELIDPFGQAVACRCGHPLEYTEEAEATGDQGRWPIYDRIGRIHRNCPSCGSPVRPQDWTAWIRDGYTGRASLRPGGVTYLFAIVVDCGKGFAREGWPMRASSPFLEAVTSVFGQSFYQVGDIH